VTGHRVVGKVPPLDRDLELDVRCVDGHVVLARGVDGLKLLGIRGTIPESGPRVRELTRDLVARIQTAVRSHDDLEVAGRTDLDGRRL
jgi:hypothetical protein